MEVKVNFQIRPADVRDEQQIASLINFESHVHKHLDWRGPLDWLGKQPYYLATQDKNIAAVLACPADPPAVAWIRLFACADWAPLEETWSSLWEAAKSDLFQQGQTIAAGIALQGWCRDLLRTSHFRCVQEIVMLEWTSQLEQSSPPPANTLVRSMTPADIETVARVDMAAFPLLWQNSLVALQRAYSQSTIATVLDVDGSIAGYQISTQNPTGFHLARLAVHPQYQRKGLGVAVLHDLLERVTRRNGSRLTVNTQSDNYGSMRLYRKMGFHPTGEHYPVYTYSVS